LSEAKIGDCKEGPAKLAKPTSRGSHLLSAHGSADLLKTTLSKIPETIRAIQFTLMATTSNRYSR